MLTQAAGPSRCCLFLIKEEIELRKLNEAEIIEQMKTVPEWMQTQEGIQRTYKLADFPRAIGFVNAISIYSESTNHHPDIRIQYNEVTLTLITWSEKGLTNKDFETARYFDFLFAEE